VWRIPREELRTRLAGGNHVFLRHIDYKSVDARDAARLGPEAPFYLSLMFRSLGMPELEQRMVELGSRVGRGVVREECDLRAVEILVDRGRYADALRLCGAVAGRISDIPRAARLRRLRIDALYASGRDQDLLALLADHLSRTPDQAALLQSDPELAFFRAAAAARLGQSEWERQFLALAWGSKSGAVHVRAYAFLEQDPQRLARFGAAELELLSGKVALAEQRTDAAVALLADAAKTLPAPAGSVVVEEAARAYLALQRYGDGVAFLRGVKAASPEPWIVDEFLGRLLRAGGQPAEAALAFESSFRTSPDPTQRQLALWHYLDLRIAAGEKNTGRLFLNRREYVTDVSYFDDLLEDAISRAVGDRSWLEIEALRDFARDKGAAEALARADFVLARAVSAGLLAGSASRSPASLLDEAIAADSGGYYALLAACLRGKPFERLAGAAEPDAADAVVTAGPLPGVDDRAVTAEGFVAGYFRYGLPVEGYRAALELVGVLPERTVLEAARELQISGYPAESIRLVAAWTRGSGSRLTRRDLELLYPSLFVSDVEKAALDREIPVQVVLGLVREESLFDPDIVSRAGAVGLTQLLPATAEEIAARMGVSSMDLRDPSTNLRLGLRHLAGLRAATRSYSRAVLAYNAGLGRLRGWEREYAGLPDELFAEAVPYAETRVYGRQVLVSAATYGVLYKQTVPEETVRLFFPDLSPVGAL
jgi:soluble lytic murein transglycosylase-like protein